MRTINLEISNTKTPATDYLGEMFTKAGFEVRVKMLLGGKVDTAKLENLCGQLMFGMFCVAMQEVEGGGRPIPKAKRWSRKGRCPNCFCNSGCNHAKNCRYFKK